MPDKRPIQGPSRRGLIGAATLAAAIGLAAPTSAQAPAEDRGLAAATFAGGCFWCMEPPFDALPGVVSTTSGYTGGTVEAPRYEQVSAGGTGHYEAVQVRYDPARVSYGRLLEVFWRNVDPLDAGGQFCDRGQQYAPAIFVSGPEERRLAEASKDRVAERLRAPVAVRVLEAGAFWPAEDYHQDYKRKNPVAYRFYRWRCGRDERLEEVWGAEAGGKVAAGD